MCFAKFLLRSTHAEYSAIHPYSDGQCFWSLSLSENLLTSHLINNYFQSRSLTFFSVIKICFVVIVFYFLVLKRKAAIPHIPVACMPQHQENQVAFIGSQKSLPHSTEWLDESALELSTREISVTTEQGWLVTKVFNTVHTRRLTAPAASEWKTPNEQSSWCPWSSRYHKCFQLLDLPVNVDIANC